MGDQVWENLNEAAMTILEGIILMTDFSILISRTEKLDYAREHLNELFGKNTPRISVRNTSNITRTSLKNWQ